MAIACFLVAGGWVGESQASSDLALARYNPDGTLDPSFGKGGKVRTGFFDEEDLADSLVIQPDGKLVAVYVNHSAAPEFAFTRLAPDGSLDTSLNGTGKAHPLIQAPSEAYAMALLLDGQAILVGSAGDGPSSDFALARVRP